MDFSLKLIDFPNPTEVFLICFTIVINGILIFLNWRKRNELVTGIRPYFNKRINPEILIKMLKHFQNVQEKYRKSIFNQLFIFYGVHLIFYFLFLYGYYRLGSFLAGLIILGLSILITQLIYKRKVK